MPVTVTQFPLLVASTYSQIAAAGLEEPSSLHRHRANKAEFPYRQALPPGPSCMLSQLPRVSRLSRRRENSSLPQYLIRDLSNAFRMDSSYRLLLILLRPSSLLLFFRLIFGSWSVRLHGPVAYFHWVHSARYFDYRRLKRRAESLCFNGGGIDDQFRSGALVTLLR